MHCVDEHRDETVPNMENTIISKQFKTNKMNLARKFNEKQCIYCKISFATIAEIDKHFQTEHQFQMQVCEKCERAYITKSALRDHCCGTLSNRRILLDFRGKRCTHCQLTFANTAESSKHFLVKHKSKILVCTKCENGFLGMARLKYHRCSSQQQSQMKKVDRPLTKHSSKPKNVKISKRSSLLCSVVNQTDDSISFQQNETFGSTLAWVADQNLHLDRSMNVNETIGLEASNNKCNSDSGKTPCTRREINSSRNIDECHKRIVERPTALFPIFRADAEKCEKKNSLNASTTYLDHSIQYNIQSGMCSTPMPSHTTKRGKTNSTHAQPEIDVAKSSIQTYFLTDTESSEAANDEVQILEWHPGTDVKPVIKFEIDMDVE